MYYSQAEWQVIKGNDTFCNKCTLSLLPRTIWPADSENTVSPPASDWSTEDDAVMWLADNSLRPTLWPAQDQLGTPEATREE